jgi:hypothetical protein
MSRCYAPFVRVVQSDKIQQSRDRGKQRPDDAAAESEIGGRLPTNIAVGEEDEIAHQGKDPQSDGET